MWRIFPLLLLIPLALAAQLERRVDERGVVHLSGKGAPPAPSSRPTPARLPEGRVVQVPDGDTVHLEGGTRLRLIGINTPEVAHHNRPGEPGGEAARRFLVARL